MDGFLDDRLRRKLVKRRGQLHAFNTLESSRTAIVVIDLVETFLDGLPDGASLIAPVNRLTAAARSAGNVVVWVKPTSPSTWTSTASIYALFGKSYVERFDAETTAGGPATTIPDSLVIEKRDWQVAKTGISAFFPGNSPLPDRLRAEGIDTIIFAGVLTDVCVAASAKDAHESGFRVLICADGVAANEPQLHFMALRTLVRVYADVRPADELIALLQDRSQ